jgi:hypothetical protein
MLSQSRYKLSPRGSRNAKRALLTGRAFLPSKRNGRELMDAAVMYGRGDVRVEERA